MRLTSRALLGGPQPIARGAAWPLGAFLLTAGQVHGPKRTSGGPQSATDLALLKGGTSEHGTPSPLLRQQLPDTIENRLPHDGRWPEEPVYRRRDKLSNSPHAAEPSGGIMYPTTPRRADCSHHWPKTQ